MAEELRKQEDGNLEVEVIHLWATPRSLSTGLMYSFAQAMYEEASQVANDAVGSIRNVASFCSESRVMEMYQKKCEATLTQEVKSRLVGGVGYGLSSFSLYCMQGLIFYFEAVLEKLGKATFGEVLKVFYALAISAIVAYQNSGMVNNINKANDPIKRIQRPKTMYEFVPC